nr:hypothetical protein [Tanacetum cinerariifolium]
MEILTLMLQRRVGMSDSFRFHRYCDDLKIINVFFADDLFLFARGDVASARVIMDSLNEFKNVSGLAKIDWLEVGDSNSVYFHKSIKSRNQRSHIDVITNADNVEVSGNAVPDVFVSHYHSFLGATVTCGDLDSKGLYNKKVSNLSNANMTCPITDDEIKRAMFGIGDEKSQGPDGYTLTFFKKGWNVISHDICSAIRDFFENGKLLKEINHTFIALIPKRALRRLLVRINQRLSYEGEFLITSYLLKSLCIIIIWIRALLGALLGVLLWWIFRKRMIQWIGDSWIAFLRAFSFYPTMVKWVMSYVTSTSYSICINEDMHGFLKGALLGVLLRWMDIQNAYDTVDWRFLDCILKGFWYSSNHGQMGYVMCYFYILLDMH